MQVSFELRKAVKEYVCYHCKKPIKIKFCYLHKCLHDEKENKYINTQICRECASYMIKQLYLKNEREKVCEK